MNRELNKLCFMLLLLAPLMLGACSSDSDDPQPEKTLLTVGADSRPTWTAPDYSLFELTMSVQVQLQDTLQTYQSDGDLMCAVFEDEVRAVSSPMHTGDITYFPLTIAGNGEGAVTIRYYCDQLHRIYTLEGWADFDPSAAPTGDGGIYHLHFIDVP